MREKVKELIHSGKKLLAKKKLLGFSVGNSSPAGQG